jgi:glucosyl-dolichyl phosphate glucuronosyltransferase
LKTKYLVGGNMFVRRSVLNEFNGFDPAYGMKGDVIGFGEETALFEKIRSAHGVESLYFDPRLFMEHVVRPEKMKWDWIIYQRIADGRDYYHLFSSKFGRVSLVRLLYRLVKNIFLLVISFTLGGILRDRKKYPFRQNYYYEQTTLYFVAISQIAEQLKKKLSFG